jgi:hypothetical protein
MPERDIPEHLHGLCDQYAAACRRERQALAVSEDATAKARALRQTIVLAIDEEWPELGWGYDMTINPVARKLIWTED